MVGHRWASRRTQIRDFLARNLVPYRWFAADEPEGRRLLEAAGPGREAIPLVVTADGRALVAAERPPRWPRRSGCPPRPGRTSTT